MLILVLGLMAGGCATVQQAPAANFADAGLRPINQDLVAWLDRLNAAPARTLVAQPSPVPSAPAPSTPLPLQVATVPPSTSMPAATLPSPGVPAPAAASTPTPPVPAVAAAAGATSTEAPVPVAKPGTTAGTAIADGVAVAPPSDPKPKPKPEWVAAPGSTLRNVVETWAQRDHWNVVWNAPVDYPIVARLRFQGTFLEAIRGIFLAHATAQRPLKAEADTTHSQLTVTE